MGSQEDRARDCQDIENFEEFVAKKKIKQGKQELMNCLCIKRRILREPINDSDS